MDIIESELSELKRVCEAQIPDSKLVACVPAMVRVEIGKSEYKKVAVCLTFPTSYPKHHILVEIKSRTLSTKLLDGLVKVSEEEAKKYIGKPHVLPILKFIDKFFEDHPLSCCSEEISVIRGMLDESTDKLKLSQKTSTINLCVQKNKYYIKIKISIPNNYPMEAIKTESYETNFPRVFRAWFTEQAKEIARRCVHKPLKPRPSDPPFKHKPSLRPAIAFMVENVKRYPMEKCQACKQLCFPEDPANAIHNENAAAHVERVYCSHCYHHDCLILYMKTPPFTGGKKCHACKQRIFHEKWKVTPELAEARWAHEQAKRRELDEVVDFFGDLATEAQHTPRS